MQEINIYVAGWTWNRQDIDRFCPRVPHSLLQGPCVEGSRDCLNGSSLHNDVLTFLSMWLACLQLGGPSMRLKTGRRDAVISLKASADKMPHPQDSVSTALAFFASFGIDTEKAVALYGKQFFLSVNSPLNFILWIMVSYLHLHVSYSL